MTIRVLLADDHRLVLDGLRHLIDHEPDMRVVGEALNGEEACRLWSELTPDLAIVDLSMPVLNGQDAIARMMAERPGPVLVLSMHADSRYVCAALKAGARGYLLKEAAFEELIRAIRSVRAGKLFLSASLGTPLLETLVERLRHDGDDPETLSGREREVLRHYAEGRSTKEIAALLHVSVKTVETHRAQIMEKLQLRSIAELTKYAIRTGLTGLD